MGIQATLKQEQIIFGNAKFMQSQAVLIEHVETQAKKMMTLGHTPLYLAKGSKLLGVISVADPVKPDAAATVKHLQKMGLQVRMLTGDNHKTAEAVAKQVGITEVLADVLPENKAEAIIKLQQQHEVVAMVGDGINDAPALAQADVGFAIGAGADIAIESADITIISNSIVGVVNAILISKATMRNIKQNLFGAFIYNSVGIPVAAGVLYPLIGVLLNPMIAGAAMAASSLTVVSNANRLRLFKIKEQVK